MEIELILREKYNDIPSVGINYYRNKNEACDN